MSDEIRKKKNWILCVCSLCPCQLSVCRKLSLRYHCSVFLALLKAGTDLLIADTQDQFGYLYARAELQAMLFHSDKENTSDRLSVIRPWRDSNRAVFLWSFIFFGLNSEAQHPPGWAGRWAGAWRWSVTPGTPWGCWRQLGTCSWWGYGRIKALSTSEMSSLPPSLPLSLLLAEQHTDAPGDAAPPASSAVMKEWGTWAPGTVHRNRLNPSPFALFFSG